MHWSVVVLILGLLAIIVYLSLRPPPEDSSGEAEQEEGKQRPKVRLTLPRRNSASTQTRADVHQILHATKSPFPPASPDAQRLTDLEKSLARLERSLAERERLVTEHELRLVECERELAEREALLLAREKLLAEREK